MDLIDRYLAAVRRNLPAAKADDIAAELADVLHSRREEREEVLDRPLTKDETIALLKEFGHPLVVAARYKPQQYLIGPDAFPFYVFVMKIVLAAGAAILVAKGALSLLFGRGALVQTLFQTLDGFWSMFFACVAVVTIVFAVLERSGFPSNHLANWTPDQLPDVRDKPQSQWESAFEVGLGIAFLLWWTGMIPLPAIVHQGGVRIVMAPVWADFYLPILLLASVQLGMNILKWIRPRWKTINGVLQIGVSIATIAVVADLYRAGHWVVVTANGMAAEEAVRLGDSVNLSLKIAMIVVVVIMILQTLGELWKLVRDQLRSSRLSAGG